MSNVHNIFIPYNVAVAKENGLSKKVSNYSTDNFNSNSLIFNIHTSVVSFLLYTFIHDFLRQIICIGGIVGNIITVFILTRHGLKDATKVLLVSITVSDCLHLLFNFLEKLVYFLSAVNGKAVLHWSVFNVALNDFTLLASYTLVAILAVEKMIAVAFPFIIARVFTLPRVKFILAVVPVYLYLIILPVFYENNKEAENLFCFTKTPKNLVFAMAITGIPMIITLTCNLVIGIKIYLMSRKFSLTAECRAIKTKKQMKAFKLLLAISCMAFINCFPSPVLYILIVNKVPGFFIRICEVILSLFDYINTSSNFIIYVTISTMFTATFKQLVCRGL